MIHKEEGRPYLAKDFKICDFGLAMKINSKSYIYKRCGTPGYVSPEIIKADSDTNSFTVTPKCDTFSVGVILYMLISRTASN